MANEAMGVMFIMVTMVNRMPKGKGKCTDEQYGDQRFNERVSGVEIHFIILYGATSSKNSYLSVRLFFPCGMRSQLSNRLQSQKQFFEI